MENWEDFYSYLAKKLGISIWASGESENLLSIFKEKLHKLALCKILQEEYDKVNLGDILIEDIAQAWSLLRQVIKLLQCDIPK